MPTPYVMLKTALDGGDLERVLQIARAVGRVRLDDALRIVLLLRDREEARYEAACVRWVGRFAIEARGVTLDDVRIAVAALDELPIEPEASMARLQALCVARGVG